MSLPPRAGTPQVLYVGDHIYSDLLRSRKVRSCSSVCEQHDNDVVITMALSNTGG